MEHIPDKSDHNQKAKDELKILAGHHSEDLYDQDEDRAGEKMNLATGENFNNSESDPAHFKNLKILEPTGSADVLPPLREEEDAAAKWLRENDPKYNG